MNASTPPLGRVYSICTRRSTFLAAYANKLRRDGRLQFSSRQSRARSSAIASPAAAEASEERREMQFRTFGPSSLTILLSVFIQSRHNGRAAFSPASVIFSI